MSIILFRIDFPFSEEEKVKAFCSEVSSYFLYGMEISKKSKKEHFHGVIKTTFHIDTIRRKLKKFFDFQDPSLYSVELPKIILNSIAYALKDGNYYIHWDDSDQIDEALALVETITEDQKLTLGQSLQKYLNDYEYKNDFICITDFTFIILKWFKEKDLSYPSQHFLKSNMIKYYMDNLEKCENNFYKNNILQLYHLSNAFIPPEH